MPWPKACAKSSSFFPDFYYSADSSHLPVWCSVRVVYYIYNGIGLIRCSRLDGVDRRCTKGQLGKCHMTTSFTNR